MHIRERERRMNPEKWPKRQCGEGRERTTEDWARHCFTYMSEDGEDRVTFANGLRVGG